MCDIIKTYFAEVFTERCNMANSVQDNDLNVITAERDEELVDYLSFEEFTLAVKQMHPNKAASPDGLNLAFFQHFWKILGYEVFLCCKGWLEEYIFPANLYDTNLVLIPKKDVVETPKDLRPISLCNVLYKIIAKVLTNRLKKILSMVVFEEQSVLGPKVL